VFDGQTFDAVSAYHNILGELSADEPGAEAQDTQAGRITSVEVLDVSRRPSAHFRVGDTMIMRIGVEALRDIDEPFVWLGINTVSGVAAYSDANVREPFPRLRAGEKAVYEVQTQLQLTTGSYSVEAALRYATGPGVSALVGRCAPENFYVTGRGFVHGVADLSGQFVVGTG
jgi:hypothetical protein